MRIGFDARWYNGSGVGTYVLELLRAMAALPEDFELIVFQQAGNSIPELNGKRISRVRMRSSKYSPAGQLELKALCKTYKIDVFHCPFYPAPLLLSCPVVVTIHDLIPFMFRSAPIWKLALVKLGYRIVAYRASHIIAVSATTANDIERILGVAPARISVIHNAASKEYFHSVSDSAEATRLTKSYNLRSAYVVSSSAHNWRTKNLEAALSALVVAKRNSNIQFQTVIYGPEDGLRALYPLDRWSELNINFIGFVPADHLGALFRHAELFITTPLYEGFGLPILEAMSCGCAVVTSNAGSLAEVADTGAQALDPRDIEGLGRAVAQLLSQTQERDRWRKQALARARDFSWSRAAQETLEVYQTVYEERHRG
jgi:glycosyltransferase involved in cell wall biosynthesis